MESKSATAIFASRIFILIGAMMLQGCVVSDRKMDETLSKSAEFKEGIRVLQTCQPARELLGDGISTGSPIREYSREQGNAGNAQINISVKGARASGLLNFVETKKAGQWSVDHMEVRLDGQTSWQVLIPAK